MLGAGRAEKKNMNAKNTATETCPRCSGTGVYEGFGVCFRCNGRKVVAAAPKHAPKAAPHAGETPSQRRERMVGGGLVSEADYNIIFSEEE
jgi:DnaJ-class molecular chaperone